MKRKVLPLLLGAAGPFMMAAQEKAPNIVLIMADDLGWGDLGCYPKGEEWSDEKYTPTPNIDRLASNGVRFNQAYATCMVSAPSRAALITGMYQQRFGFYSFSETYAPLPQNIRTLPEMLKQAGYRTGMMGKWHVSTAEGSRPLDRGFDRFFGFLAGQHDYYYADMGQTYHGVGNAMDAYTYDQDKPAKKIKFMTDELTDRALAFMEEEKDKPFFLYLPYNAPHPPMQAPWEYTEKYAKDRPKQRPTSRDLARASIENMDWNIGRVMAWLKENGLEENTIIIFTSDNGGSDASPQKFLQHNGGLKGRKSTFYEGGVRVSFIMSWPQKLQGGVVFDGASSHMDIFATAVAVAGVEKKVPQKLDGVNLIPYLTGEKKGAPHDALYWTLEVPSKHWAVRDGDWKLILEDIHPETLGGGRKEKAVIELQLYNIAKDPSEKNNLVREHPEIVSRLEKRMDEFRAQLAPSAYTDEVKKRHQAALEARKNNPALKDVKQAIGSPGHWFGGGAKQRIEDEAAGVID